jgi:hypothetical protein
MHASSILMCILYCTVLYCTVFHQTQAVLYQGWLQKRRGGQAAVKTAQWRYFVLYATPQGPYLAYYAGDYYS